MEEPKRILKGRGRSQALIQHLLSIYYVLGANTHHTSFHRPPQPPKERGYILCILLRGKIDPGNFKPLAPDDLVDKKQRQNGSLDPLARLRVFLENPLSFGESALSLVCLSLHLHDALLHRRFLSSLRGREKEFQGKPSSSPASSLKAPLLSVSASVTVATSAVPY